MSLPPVVRPDGRLYRPRKLAAYPVTDDGGDFSGVLVLGTHDPAVAQPAADELARQEAGSGWRAVSPVPGWWRDGLMLSQRCWIGDEINGRAGVLFERVDETGPGCSS